MIIFLPLDGVKAACSGSDCCTITSGVVTAPDNDACMIQPSTYGITLYDKYLCTDNNESGVKLMESIPLSTKNLQNSLLSDGC